MYPNLNVPLNDQQHFGLSKINEIKDYFVIEIYFEAKGISSNLGIRTPLIKVPLLGNILF